MRASSRRFTFVGTCLALWLGAAALACGVFTPQQIAPENESPAAATPVVVGGGVQEKLAMNSDSLQSAAARASLSESPLTLAKP